jgi:uncharacterized protein (DUF305 family)
MRFRAHPFLLAVVIVMGPVVLLSGPGQGAAALQGESSDTVALCELLAATPSAATPVIAASPSPAAIEFDLIYLDLMIAQQARVRDLAKLAAVQAESPEVRRLGDETFDGTEPILDRLQDTRAAWFDDRPVLQDAALISALDEIGRLQPAVGGVPGAVEIVQGEGAIAELCAETSDFDVHFLTTLIEQLDGGILFSEAAMQLAGRDETKVIAALVVETEQPFKDNAISYRDLLLQGSPIPADH